MNPAYYSGAQGHGHVKTWRIKGDVLILYLLRSTSMLRVLQDVDAVMMALSASPDFLETPRNYITLLHQEGIGYRALLPLSGEMSDAPQPYGLSVFVEVDEERAIQKAKHAYDKGLDTDPAL